MAEERAGRAGSQHGAGGEPAPSADLHAHCTLKPYLLGHSLWAGARPERGFAPFAFRTSLNSLLRGGIRIACVAHYVPEESLFRDSLLVRAVARISCPTYPWLRAGRPWQRLQEMMDVLEYEAGRAPGLVGMARGPDDVRSIRGNGRLALVHTVEGAHVLEGEPERIDELADCGVAMMGLAHLFPNRLVRGVDGVPDYPLVRALSRYRFPAADGPPITDAGREVVRRMVAEGIMVDLAHADPEARREILGEVGGRVPVVASHVGLRSLNDRAYNLTDDEVRAIASSGGLIGIILMPYWLTGRSADGLEAVWRTALRVRRITGSWSHVAIGSDLDGFTRPPREVTDASGFPALAGLFRARGVPESAVREIMIGNAERLLTSGWAGGAGAAAPRESRSQGNASGGDAPGGARPLP